MNPSRFLLVTCAAILCLAAYTVALAQDEYKVYLPNLHKGGTTSATDPVVIPTSTPTLTNTPTPTSTATASNTPTNTPTSTATNTPTATSTPTATATPTATPTPCGYLSGRITENLLLVPHCDYEVTAPTLVDVGATLTIPQGVVLEFYSNAYLAVRGTLDAQGTAGAPIQFIGYRYRSSWRGIHIEALSGSSSVIRHAIISGIPTPTGREHPAALALSGAPVIDRVQFSGNYIGIRIDFDSGMTLPITVTNSTFVNNSVGIITPRLYNESEVLTIKNSVFRNNQTGVASEMLPTVIEGNLFENNVVGAGVTAGNIVRGNVFRNNSDYGIGTAFSPFYVTQKITITHNTFENNAVSIFNAWENQLVIGHNLFTGGRSREVELRYYRCGIDVHHNNFINHAPYSIYLLYQEDDCLVNATDNWWGTTNPAKIEAAFYPQPDFDPPPVIYHPFAAAPIEGAGAP